MRFLCWLIFVGFIQISTVIGKPLTVAVSVVSKSHENAVIGLTLRNVSNKTVYIWDASMPWSCAGHGMTLIAMRNAPYPELMRDVRCMESGAGYVVMRPHSKLYGEVQLCEGFELLESVRVNHEIVLLWTHNSVAYPKKSLENGIKNREGGMLLIPKRALKSGNPTSVECLPQQ